MTVREATFDFLRRRGLTDIFSNPGSTEVPFLTGLPDDLRFVLGLHEGAVVEHGERLRARPAAAVVRARCTRRPGSGNAVNAISTARVNRTPVVIAVGQQDRRHLAFEPFLAGRLEGLAGDYPVWVDAAVRARRTSLGALERAYHEAETRRGPAIVIVPMGDWLEDAGEPHEVAAPAARAAARRGRRRVGRGARRAARPARRGPALVAGARLDTPERWAALVALAERLGAPVYQEAFSGQAGFPQDHPLWAGPLPFLRAAAARDARAVRPRRRRRRAGLPPDRLRPGAVRAGRDRLAMVSDDPDEVHRSPAELAVLGAPGLVCARSPQRRRATAERPRRRCTSSPSRPPPGAAAPRRPRPRRRSATGCRADAVVVEECPSNRVELTLRIPARQPLGFVSAAMGGLGWGLPAAVGLRMGLPERPVVAVLGDGSTVFGIHGLWSAAHYGVGAALRRAEERRLPDHGPARRAPGRRAGLAVVRRGRHRRDRARRSGARPVASATRTTLGATLDEVVPGLRDRSDPLAARSDGRARLTCHRSASGPGAMPGPETRSNYT